MRGVAMGIIVMSIVGLVRVLALLSSVLFSVDGDVTGFGWLRGCGSMNGKTCCVLRWVHILSLDI
jgi:hypothetical protein